jgi:predicted nucleic acid-binding protein
VGLSADLGRGAAAIDTSIFIYFIEEHPRFLSLVLPLFEEADGGKRELVTSAVTLLEVLVVPYRAGDVQLAERYELCSRGAVECASSTSRAINSERQRSSAPSRVSGRPMRYSSCARLEPVARRS